MEILYESSSVAYPDPQGSASFVEPGSKAIPVDMDPDLIRVPGPTIYCGLFLILLRYFLTELFTNTLQPLTVQKNDTSVNSNLYRLNQSEQVALTQGSGSVSRSLSLKSGILKNV
jgi:hypothetical protein